MKRHIKIGFIATSILLSSMVNAMDNNQQSMDMQNMSGDPAQMQQMMEQRMVMMKSGLNLNAKQEKAFDAFAQQKKSLMKGMMQHKQARMKDMKGGQKGNMQGMDGCQNGMAKKMAMMSSMSFEERLNMMQKHAEKMQATSKAGKNFYNSLDSGQKTKLNDMHKNMKGMDMKKMP